MQDGKDTTPITERKVVRRGLIAGIAGMGAAAVLKVTGASKVEAADGAALTLGSAASNGSTTQTQWVIAAGTTTGFQIIRNAASTGSFNTAMQIMSDQGAGIVVFTNSSNSNFPAVRGENSTSNGIGVMGISTGTNGQGVRGAGSANGTGVRGVSNVTSGDNSSEGTGVGFGVRGLAAGGVGVQGDATSGTGVRGLSNASTSNTGDGSGIGVHGRTGNGAGVLGEAILTAGGPTAFGVRGVAAGNGTGVRGVSNTGGDLVGTGNGSGSGVHGLSGSGNGVFGASSSGAGLRGISSTFVGAVGVSTTSHGLYGFTTNSGIAAVVGESAAGAAGLAGHFNGSVFITGNLQVQGAKNAVLKMPDGSNALVYCQEAPEPYFEDFGRAHLRGGVANVPLDREFAALVSGAEYHVFTEAEGESKGLFVSARTANGFEVREIGGGTSNAAFSYRIVTKRKDIEGKRFARVSDDHVKALPSIRAALGVGGPANGGPQGPTR